MGCGAPTASSRRVAPATDAGRLAAPEERLVAQQQQQPDSSVEHTDRDLLPILLASRRELCLSRRFVAFLEMQVAACAVAAPASIVARPLSVTTDTNALERLPRAGDGGRQKRTQRAADNAWADWIKCFGSTRRQGFWLADDFDVESDAACWHMLMSVPHTVFERDLDQVKLVLAMEFAQPAKEGAAAAVSTRKQHKGVAKDTVAFAVSGLAIADDRVLPPMLGATTDAEEEAVSSDATVMNDGAADDQVVAAPMSSPATMVDGAADDQVLAAPMSSPATMVDGAADDQVVAAPMSSPATMVDGATNDQVLAAPMMSAKTDAAQVVSSPATMVDGAIDDQGLAAVGVMEDDQVPTSPGTATEQRDDQRVVVASPKAFAAAHRAQEAAFMFSAVGAADNSPRTQRAQAASQETIDICLQPQAPWQQQPEDVETKKRADRPVARPLSESRARDGAGNRHSAFCRLQRRCRRIHATLAVAQFNVHLARVLVPMAERMFDCAFTRYRLETGQPIRPCNSSGGSDAGHADARAPPALMLPEPEFQYELNGRFPALARIERASWEARVAHRFESLGL